MRLATFRWLALAVLAAAPPARAVPTTVVSDDTGPCDFLSVPQTVHELGEAPAFTPFPTELISAVSTFIDLVACPSTDGPAPNALVAITNLTGLTWSDLWYVGDPPAATGGGGTTFTNEDGIVNGGLAFKIDAVGLNTPLIFESIAADGIFVPLETWHFIIDDYANTVPLPADALDSIGVGSFSAGGPPSSGSIIALQGHGVPEPARLGLALVCAASLALRRQKQG
jgi:hypothetical protein